MWGWFVQICWCADLTALNDGMVWEIKKISAIKLYLQWLWNQFNQEGSYPINCVQIFRSHTGTAILPHMIKTAEHYDLTLSSPRHPIKDDVRLAGVAHMNSVASSTLSDHCRRWWHWTYACPSLSCVNTFMSFRNSEQQVPRASTLKLPWLDSVSKALKDLITAQLVGLEFDYSCGWLQWLQRLLPEI